MSNIDILSASDLIGTNLLIKTKDNRELTGVLLVIDNKPNILINNVVETSIQHGKPNKRELGLVSVPYTTIKTVKIKTDDLEKTIQWKSTII